MRPPLEFATSPSFSPPGLGGTQGVTVHSPVLLATFLSRADLFLIRPWGWFPRLPRLPASKGRGSLFVPEIGYARISLTDQDFAFQREALRVAGCTVIREEGEPVGVADLLGPDLNHSARSGEHQRPAAIDANVTTRPS